MVQMIDVFKAGSYLAYRDENGRIQTDVLEKIISLGDIESVSLSDEVVIVFSSGTAVYFNKNNNTEEDRKNHTNRLYDTFMNGLKQKYPDFYYLYSDQIAGIKKDIKERIRKNPTPKVKRFNKYARRRLAALGTVASVVIICGVAYSILHQTPVEISSPNTGTSQPYMGEDSEFTNIFESTTSTSEEVTTTNTTATTITSPSYEESSDYVFSIDYKNVSPEGRELIKHPEYEEYIKRYSEEFHVDYNVMRGIALQENGSDYTGFAYGLMQIENIWIGNEISAYNFAQGKKVRYNVYDSNSYVPQAQSYTDTNGNVVEYKDVNDPENNILFSCMVFQNCLTACDDNLMAAIQCYNFGYGNFDKALSYYGYASGLEKEEILKDKSNLGWMDYLSYIQVGDPEYIGHVMQWLDDRNEFKTINDDGTVFEKYVVKKMEKIY